MKKTFSHEVIETAHNFSLTVRSYLHFEEQKPKLYTRNVVKPL